MKKYSEKDLLDEIIAIHDVPTIKDDDITVAKVRDRLGIGNRLAWDILEEEVRKGKLVKVSARGYDGHRANVYRSPE